MWSVRRPSILPAINNFGAAAGGAAAAGAVRNDGDPRVVAGFRTIIANVRYDATLGCRSTCPARRIQSDSAPFIRCWYRNYQRRYLHPQPRRSRSPRSNQFGFRRAAWASSSTSISSHRATSCGSRRPIKRARSSFTEGGNLSFINGAPGAQSAPRGTNPGFFNVGYAAHANGFRLRLHAGRNLRPSGRLRVPGCLQALLDPDSFASSVLRILLQDQQLAGCFERRRAAGAYGSTNYEEIKAGTNLTWTPVKGFDIGAEFFYFREIASGPSDQLLRRLELCRCDCCGTWRRELRDRLPAQPNASRQPRTSTKAGFAFSVLSDPELKIHIAKPRRKLGLFAFVDRSERLRYCRFSAI